MKYIFFLTILLISFSVCFTSCTTSGDGIGGIDTVGADAFGNRKKDTVYVYKTVYKTDTIYKTVTNTVYKTDTVYKTATRVDTVIQFKTIYKTDTIYIIKHDDTTVINIPPFKPIFGVLNAELSFDETANVMRQSGVNVQRVAMFFSSTYFSKSADQYIKAGFNVQINFNYKPTNDPVGWCTDTAFVRKQAKLFFAYYKPYINQIPLVAVENEWDNVQYHAGNIDDYIRELAIVVDEGHKAGFKITDAGITSNALQRWNYSQLSGDSATWWKANYFVGVSNDYTNYINSINYYASKVKSIPIDFVNFHWYNNVTCSKGLPSALNHWLKATGKTVHGTNEWGVKDASLWDCTISEVVGVNPVFAIAYSGVNNDNKAVVLTADMLQKMIN